MKEMSDDTIMDRNVEETKKKNLKCDMIPKSHDETPVYTVLSVEDVVHNTLTTPTPFNQSQTTPNLSSTLPPITTISQLFTDNSFDPSVHITSTEEMVLEDLNNIICPDITSFLADC